MTDLVHSGLTASIPSENEAGAISRPVNGPELWKHILADMPSGAVVAGGAIRDYLLGVEPKDIDVFCPSNAFGGGFDFSGFEPLGEDRSAEYEAMQTIDVVQRTSRYGIQVDLVGVCLPEWSPLALVQTFDFGITRGWFDGEALHDLAEAGYDRAHNVVTLMLPDRPERAAERFARFNAAHGGRFTLVTEIAA